MNETDQSPDTDRYVEQTQVTGGYRLDQEQEHVEQFKSLKEPYQQITPLSFLSVTLTLRCGSLNLTIEELRRLGSGTVLEVQGVTPGYASLCHGEQVVAEGELVDVAGRLGLQITRMASLL